MKENSILNEIQPCKVVPKIFENLTSNFEHNTTLKILALIYLMRLSKNVFKIPKYINIDFCSIKLRIC